MLSPVRDFGMAPLTSTSSCESCINLSQKVIELEQRISTLYQIQGAERELDTILLGKAQTTATSTELPDAVVQTHRGELCFTPAPRRRGPMARLHGSHSRGPAGASPFEHPRCRGAVAPPLSTLVLGDSIVRNVRMRGALTLSFPGATVVDIVDRIPNILASHPQANRLIIHIGTNDIPKQQSELLNAFISGPTPTCGRGIGRFSRLLSLNTWLSSACVSHGVGFINNFDAFWERRHLFGADGLHLNAWGTVSSVVDLAVSDHYCVFFNITGFIQRETSVRTVRRRYLTSEVATNFTRVLDQCPPVILFLIILTAN
uniref:SGNH hydrolase-type esterase domain-containing protein n=1 Tax=Oreochromis aureus TaxID=47969 RepID=A0AAZ1XRI8_OREAU